MISAKWAAAVLAFLACFSVGYAAPATDQARRSLAETSNVESNAGKTVGKVTSGGFAPTLGRAVAMGYVERSHSANGTKVDLLVRGKPVPAEIVPMPFVKHAYYRG